MRRFFILLTIFLTVMINLSVIPVWAAGGTQQIAVYFQNKSGTDVNMWLGHFKADELKKGKAVMLKPGGHTLYYCSVRYDKKDDSGGYFFVNDKIFASVVEGKELLPDQGGDGIAGAISGRFTVNGYLKGVSIIYDGKSFYARITYKDGNIEEKTIQTSGQTETKEALPVAGVMVTLIPAALIGALAMKGKNTSSGDSEDENRDTDKKYYLAISKEFGNKVRCDDDAVSISAAIVEVIADENGNETESLLPHLSEQIEISAKESFVELSEAVMEEGYKTINFMVHSDEKGLPPADTLTLTFTFRNSKGYLIQNLIFKVIGKPYIELEKEKLFVLAASGKTFDLKYELKDFVSEADIEVNCFRSHMPFDVGQGKNINEENAIIATDLGLKKPAERFFDSYDCEIIAKNEKEYARSVFSVVMCYEGVLPDFLGKEKEIVAYKNEKGEMPVTDIAFRLGIWDENEKTLMLSRPSDVEVNFTDEQGIFELIGLENEINLDKSTSDYVAYEFKAEKSLPSTSPVPGTLSVLYQSDEVSFESATKVRLMPDLLTYEKELEKEYQNCIRIIDTYLPPEFAAKKHRELNASRDKMGLQDLQLFRKKCWEIASRCIMQEKESYMIASYWYDEAIATAELVVYVGDAALDVALAPFGGPITGFVVSHVKASLIELISMRIEKGSIGYNEIYDLIMKRLEQAAGQADGLIETPGFDKPKALVAWLSCYILYRIMYRWYFDKDDSGNPKGLAEAIQNGLMDFAGKGASILLGEYAKDIAKKRGIDAGSTADKEQKWVNEQVGNAAKKGLDTMDTVADALDKKINEITASLLDFIDRIRNGGVNFY